MSRHVKWNSIGIVIIQRVTYFNERLQFSSDKILILCILGEMTIYNAFKIIVELATEISLHLNSV